MSWGLFRDGTWIWLVAVVAGGALALRAWGIRGIARASAIAVVTAVALLAVMTAGYLYLLVWVPLGLA